LGSTTEINLVHLNQFRVFSDQHPKSFNLSWKILFFVEGTPIKMIHPGITTQQAEAYLRAKLRFCFGSATDYWANIRLMNAPNAILHFMCPFLVLCLLLFQKMTNISVPSKLFSIPIHDENIKKNVTFQTL